MQLRGFRLPNGKKTHLYEDCATIPSDKRSRLISGVYEGFDTDICYECRGRKLGKNKRQVYRSSPSKSYL